MNQFSPIPIIWEDKKFPGSYFKEQEYEILNRFAERFNQRFPIMNIEVHVDFTNNSADKIKFFDIKLHVRLKNGKILIGTAQNKSIQQGLREAITFIKHEADRYEKHLNKNKR